MSENEVVIDSESGQCLDASTALQAVSRAEIDIQVATAHAYPRSIKQFVNDATEMATMNEEIAGECMYALKRDGKTIEGPSARFAEIVLSAWGNSRGAARIVAEDDRFITSQAACHDLQRNVAVSYETRRRITNKYGKKYSDDMVGVTANAASSIALRNAVLKVVPKAFWKPIYDAARKTAIGDAKTLSSKRTEMLAYFAKLGASKEQLFEFLEVAGEAEISLDHLALMKGIATAIKDGETTIEMALGRPEIDKSKVGDSDLNSKLNSDNPPAADDPDDLSLEAAIGQPTFEELAAEISKTRSIARVNAIIQEHVGDHSEFNDEGQLQLTQLAEKRRRELQDSAKAKQKEVV